MYYELVPGSHAINVDQTWRAEITGNSVDYYSPNNSKESINYGSAPAAQAAYDEFLVMSISPAPGVVVGDYIQFAFTATHSAATADLTWQVLHVPTITELWWVFALYPTLEELVVTDSLSVWKVPAP